METVIGRGVGLRGTAGAALALMLALAGCTSSSGDANGLPADDGSRAAAGAGVAGGGSSFPSAAGAAGGAAGTSASPTDPGGFANSDSFGQPVAGAAGAPVTGAAGAAGSGAQAGGAAPPPANTNVSLGGAQDFGYWRGLVANGTVPRVGDFDAAGFFAEHHTALPDPTCGEQVCLQTMLGVLGNLMNGNNCTMLQLGLNSPIAANPDNRPPLTLAVVVDVSGSMNTDGKIDFVKQGLGLLIDGMRDTDRLALITYSTQAQVVFPMGDVALNRVELRGIVDELVASGNTNIYDGLEAGYDEVLADYDSGRQNRVILLSDGVATTGITGTPQIMDMSRGYNSDGIGLTTVGLGSDFNVELMRGLAEQGDGNTYFLENAGAVDEVFAEELSYFTVPVAFDLSLSVVQGEHYEFRRAYGSSFWEDTADGGSLEVPSVFLAHRESANDVTSEDGRRGGGSALMIELMPTLTEDDGSGLTSADVATIDVSFREPGTNRIVQDQIVVEFPMAPWITPATGFFDSPDLAIIQKSFVMLNIYVTFEEASLLFYDNQPAEARAVIERVMAGVEDYNEEAQDLDIELDLQMMADLRDLIAESGVELPQDFSVPPDPWPAD